MRRRGAYSEQATERIEAQVGLLERLIGDLSDVAGLQARRLELLPRRVDLGVLVRDCVDQVRRQDTSHVVQVAVPAGALEGTWDPERLSQVLQNLLANAIKYSPDGGTVAVTVEDLGDRAQVSIRDMGLGIPPEALPRLFDQFYRVEEHRGAPGLGLGLYIARSLIEAHGGRIRAESEGPGQGSTFLFTLPYEPPTEDDASSPANGEMMR